MHGVRPARKPAPAGAIAAASKRSQRFRQFLLTYAACLHNNGAGTPPPNTSGGGTVFSLKGLNTASPRFKAAARTCRSTIVAALRAARPGSASPSSSSAKPKP